MGLKTVARNTGALWDSDRVQVDAYSYALEQMGFDCSNLTCIILKITRCSDVKGRGFVLWVPSPFIKG